MPVAEKFLNPDELTNVQALASFDGKTLMPRYHYMDVLAREHAVAFSVAKMMDEDMLADVQSALTDALSNSTDFDVFKKRMEPYLMAKGWWGKELVVDPLTGDAKKYSLARLVVCVRSITPIYTQAMRLDSGNASKRPSAVCRICNICHLSQVKNAISINSITTWYVLSMIQSGR